MFAQVWFAGKCLTMADDRLVTISHASGSLTFPANFVLVAALNPCPYGWYGDDRHTCTCSSSRRCVTRSASAAGWWIGIDIHLGVQRVPYQKLDAAGSSEPPTVIRGRVHLCPQLPL